MKAGDLLEVTIIDDNHLGNGIAKFNDFTIFVPKTIKGDIVKIKVLSIKKNIVLAKVIDFIEKSKNHFNIKCPYYDKCGGCNLLHISYERENDLKEKYVKRLFGLDCNIVSFDRENYRNKVTLHVNNSLGLYEESSNTIVPVDYCLLLDKDINDLITIIKNFDLSNIKEVVIKKASEGLLISVKGKLVFADLEILKKHVKSVYQNNKLIYGKEYLTISLGDINYNINHESFFQINKECAKALYDKIKEEVGVCDSLLDLYCGTGSIGIYLSEKVKHITGVEINKESVRCAEKNIKDNNIKNYKIINADASSIDKDYEVVVVDPPRNGLSKEVISILNNMNTKKLIYVSCNPSTLKRDIGLLNSFSMKKVFVFNMFPGTYHIENLVIFDKIDNV